MKKDDQSDPTFRSVAGIQLQIAPDRPDLLLVELKTLQGPLRFAMPKSIALKVAAHIEENAMLLTPDRSAN